MREIRVYQTEGGRRPFLDWLYGLKDKVAISRIDNKINRLALQCVSDCKAIKNGVIELRIHFGPGYRVYFTTTGNILVLLIGGCKKTQRSDIKQALVYLKDYAERK